MTTQTTPGTGSAAAHDAARAAIAAVETYLRICGRHATAADVANFGREYLTGLAVPTLHEQITAVLDDRDRAADLTPWDRAQIVHARDVLDRHRPVYHCPPAERAGCAEPPECVRCPVDKAHEWRPYPCAEVASLAAAWLSTNGQDGTVRRG